jgi:hypothetical protein
MSWWIIGLGVWLSPALLVGAALLVVARRPPSTATPGSMGFWWDAQARVWNPADAQAIAHSATEAAVDLFEADVRWPTSEIDAEEATMGRFRPLLPPAPPAPAPCGS